MTKEVRVICDRCRTVFVPVSGDRSNRVVIIDMTASGWDESGDRLTQIDLCVPCMVEFETWAKISIEF